MSTLDDVRAQIDALDARLVALLAERQGLVEQAGACKTTAAEVVAEERVQALLADRRAKARAAGLDEEVAASVFLAVVASFTAYERARVVGSS